MVLIDGIDVVFNYWCEFGFVKFVLVVMGNYIFSLKFQVNL